MLSNDLWERTQADLRTLSTDGMELEALGSGHFVQDDAPAVVVGAVSSLVSAAQTGMPLPPCEQVISDLEARCLGS